MSILLVIFAQGVNIYVNSMNDFINLTQKGYDEFSREYGDKKVRKIEAIILKSKYTNGLINNSRQNRFVPTVKDIGACVSSNFKMAFSNSATTRFACHILLEKWNWEVNEELQLASENELVSLYKEIDTFMY